MSNESISEFERARIALGYIPPDDRETWQKVGMALKAEFGDEAFAAWDEWSQGASSYKAADVRDVWKSFKGGRITINTLFHLAKQNGFDPRQHKATPVAPAERKRQQAARAAREAAEQKGIASKQRQTATLAASIWAAAEPAPVDHPYLVRKQIAAGELRVYRGDLCIGDAACDGALIVPARDAAGELWTLEFILADGQKRFLPNGRKSGSFALVGGEVSSTVLVGEGYATCATLAAATGMPAAVAFDAGNLLAVATALRGRYPDAGIVLCADDDHATPRNPGVIKSRAAAEAVGGAVAVPDFGPDRPAAGTDFNDLAAHLGSDAVAACVRAAAPASGSRASGNTDAPVEAAKPAKRPKSARASADSQSRFTVDEKGVWYFGVNKEGDALPPQWICEPLEIVAETRNEANTEWGVLLEFSDRDGKPKHWAMPRRMLAGDGSEYRAVLMDMGLNIAPTAHAKQLLATYIQSARTAERARCTGRVGWHGDAFVLPDQTIGAGSELTIFQTDGMVESPFKQRGSLDDWRREVAALCVDNSRLMFCVSCAFAGALLAASGQQSGGFHLMGDSTVGKTTALRVAASVFGGRDFLRSWRATGNAMESTAAQHSDTLLILDEIGQVDPKEVGDIVYMIGNEAGKGRATRTATAKPVATWRLLFLSSGEKDLVAIMGEASKAAKAGQGVRLATIPADAGHGLGMFETLHQFHSAKALADHIVRAAAQYYGEAGIAFIRHASENAEQIPDVLAAMVASLVDAWVPDGAHGQVARVAQRFALVGAAGELATEAGVTGWNEGASMVAAEAVFKSWLTLRGSHGNAETIAMLRQVRAFFEAHGDARFIWMQRSTDDRRANVMHRAGYKRLVKGGRSVNTNQEYMSEFGEQISDADAEQTEMEFFVLPEVFREEVCRGFDHRAVARTLIECNVLMTTGNGRPDMQIRVPGLGRIRAYHVLPSIFDISVA
nr:DUF927 domain-containing protein [Burkholderia ambifaria]